MFVPPVAIRQRCPATHTYTAESTQRRLASSVLVVTGLTMDSDEDDDFYGIGLAPKVKTADVVDGTSADSSASEHSDKEESNSASDAESSSGEDDGESKSQKSAESSSVESDSNSDEAESHSTEDDPLSDVWDSADDVQEGGSEKGAEVANEIQHEYVMVPTSAGMYKLDLTPPETLLIECGKRRTAAYQEQRAEECVRESIRQLALTRIVFGDGAVWKLAECNARIAQAYWEMLEYEAQTYHYAQEACRLLTLGVPRTPVVAPSGLPVELPAKAELMDTAILTYYILAKGLLALKRVSEAEQSLIKAQHALNERKQIGEKNGNRIGFWTTEIASAFARVKICQKRPEDALKYLHQVRKLVEKRYGSEDIRLISVYQEIGKVETEPEAAAESYLAAYNIAKAKWPQNEYKLGEAAEWLAAAYAKVPTPDGEVYAESYYEEAIKCYELALGAEGKKTLKTRERLAEHLANRGRWTEATESVKAVLRVVEHNDGEFSAHAARLYKSIANYALGSGNVSEGRQQLRKAVELETKLFGPNDRRTEASRQALLVLSKNQQTTTKPRFQPVVKTAAALGGYRRVMDDY